MIITTISPIAIKKTGQLPELRGVADFIRIVFILMYFELREKVISEIKND